MTEYAISHAPIGVTYVARASTFTDLTTLPEILRLAKDAEKETFLSEFSHEDRVYIEMGGASDQIMLLALASGCEVISIPSFMLGDKTETANLLTTRNWNLKDEKSRGSETGDKLTARRNRALALVASAATNDPRLVPCREDEWRILSVKMLYRSFRQNQKAFLVAFQQLLARLRLDYVLEAAEKTITVSDYILEAAEKTTAKDARPEKRHGKAFDAKQTLGALLTIFSEEERAEFLKKIGIDDVTLATHIPHERVNDLFEKITERLMVQDVTVSTIAAS